MLVKLYHLLSSLPHALSRSAERRWWQLFWSREHELQKKEFGRDAKPIAGSERSLFVEKVSSFRPFVTCLEVGCAYGQNFHIMAPLFPKASFVGVDKNGDRIEGGATLLEEAGIANAELKVGDVLELPFSDNSFEIVSSAACLLYLSPEEVSRAVAEMTRVARRAIVLLELSSEKGAGSVTLHREDGTSYWAHDFVSLLGSESSIGPVEVSRLSNSLWVDEDWNLFGSVVSASLVH